MSKWIGVTVVAGVVAGLALGCAQQPSATAAGVESRSYKVTPASVTVRAGIIAGEVTEMKVTEMVEQGSDRVVSPAKLTGTLRLRNTSANQTVHLVGGKIQYRASPLSLRQRGRNRPSSSPPTGASGSTPGRRRPSPWMSSSPRQP